MNKIINTFKGLFYLGDRAVNIKDKFSKKVEISILIAKDNVIDVKVPENKLNVYLKVIKDIFPDCKIIIL